MRDKASHGAFMRRFGAVLALAVAIGAVVGSSVWNAPSAQAQATTVTVQKELVGPSGTPVGGDLSGYVFTLQGNGLTIPMPATNAAGQTAIGVAAGTYTITETPKAGSTLVGFFLNNVQVASFTVGATAVTITARNQVAGTGVVTVTKQVVDANGAQVAGADLSGFAFRLTGPSGFDQSQTTAAAGTVTFGNLAPGTYTINETAKTGFTLKELVVNGTIAQNGAQFQVGTGTTSTIIARNTAVTTGNVTITKNIVDSAGAAVPSGDRSGFRFTFVQGNTTVTSDATTAAGTASVTLPPGTYTFNETTRTGCSFVSATVNNGTLGNGGTFTVAAGQSYAIVVNNNCGTGGGGGRMDPLFNGCNNIAITHPAGTPLPTVAQGITGTLESIFRYDNAQGKFFGWAPNAPAFAVDYPTVVNKLEPVFICMRSTGQITQPAA